MALHVNDEYTQRNIHYLIVLFYQWLITTSRYQLQVNVLSKDNILMECLASWNEIFLLEFEFIITMICFWNLCEHAYLFLIFDSTLANAANLSTQVKGIPKDLEREHRNCSPLYGIRPSIKNGMPYFYSEKPQ